MRGSAPTVDTASPGRLVASSQTDTRTVRSADGSEPRKLATWTASEPQTYGLYDGFV